MCLRILRQIFCFSSKFEDLLLFGQKERFNLSWLNIYDHVPGGEATTQSTQAKLIKTTLLQVQHNEEIRSDWPGGDWVELGQRVHTNWAFCRACWLKAVIWNRMAKNQCCMNNVQTLYPFCNLYLWDVVLPGDWLRGLMGVWCLTFGINLFWLHSFIRFHKRMKIYNSVLALVCEGEEELGRNVKDGHRRRWRRKLNSNLYTCSLSQTPESYS